MKKVLIISIIVGVIVLLILGFFVLNNKAGSETEQIGDKNSTPIYNCGKMENPSCFTSRMTQCSPVTAQLTSVEGTILDITILGKENDKCHFQRKANNSINFNCYFLMNNLDSGWDLIDQTFGNEKGLQSVVDSACH